jgi:hypothetical protein
VAVFIDYQNAYKRSRGAYDPDDLEPKFFGQVNPHRLGLRLTGPDRELVSVRVYRGLPSAEHDKPSASAADRQIAAWEKLPLVVTYTRPLNYRVVTDPKEKGIDVALAVDFVVMSQTEYDVGILVSADTDLLPALEAVVAAKGASGCEVVCWVSNGGKNQVLRVPGQAIKVHAIYRPDYEKIADLNDYNVRTRRR